MTTELIERIENQSALVGIVGLGYVGLPLARAFITAGYRVLGFDLDQSKVEFLLSGKCYIGHLDATWIATCVKNRSLIPTSDMHRLDEPDVILICVPTPLTASREPDLSFVESTARQIKARLRPGQLIVLESTTYPGTTKGVVLPLLEDSGLKCGIDFLLAYSPEREDPGNRSFSADTIPKVVGGFDVRSRAAAEALYRAVVVDVVPVSSCEVAEFSKILENTYRAVNIALVNELKMLCDKMKIDVWEVIEAAKTKPFGFHAFYPGPGLGGHCIPIDPFYLSWVARKHGTSTRFIELAGEVNAAMPQYVLSRLAMALNNEKKPVRGSKIAILGVAYKKDVDDPRESPAFVLMERLLEQGAAVTYNDPFIPHLPKMRAHQLPEMSSCELTSSFLAEQDCVLIATNHSQYNYDFIVEHSKLVVDTRNATGSVRVGRENIVKA